MRWCWWRSRRCTTRSIRAPGERYQVVVHVDAAVLADPTQPGESALEDGAGFPRKRRCDHLGAPLD
jgi:hypothetical protein